MSSKPTWLTKIKHPFVDANRTAYLITDDGAAEDGNMNSEPVDYGIVDDGHCG